MRTSKQEWFLDIAERCAKQGTCLLRVYGAVIVDTEGAIISTGYCGAPRGEKDCLEIGKCWRKKNNIKSGSGYEKCRSVHAEMNACIQAGKSTRGATIYIAALDVETEENIPAIPCALCTRVLINAGVTTAICRMSDGTLEEFDIKDLQHDNNGHLFGDDF